MYEFLDKQKKPPEEIFIIALFIMSLWQQIYNPQLVNSSDKSPNNTCHDLEILNNTPLNLVRQETQINSHTVAKINSKEKIKDLLPYTDTNVHSSHFKRSSQDRSVDNEVKKPLSDSLKSNLEKTKRSITQKVTFSIDSDHNQQNNEEEKTTIINEGNNNENHDLSLSSPISPKAYRRASAPAHGMPFVYFSTSEITSIHYFGHSELENNKVHDQDNQNSKMPTVHEQTDPDKSNLSSPLLSPMSPCSSISSIGSPTDISSPT
ncbi:1252_t:CDS:1, partial [Scutellospora calospora]